MTWHIRLLAGLLGIGLLAPPALAQGSDQPAAPQARAAQPADQIQSAIQAIQQAADPSAAVAAYARGAAADPTNRQLLNAYVNKLVAFGLPDVAYQQAQRLVDVDPNNGVAWAVLAYMAARQGQMAEALADVAQAGNRAPDDRFVQETAGQLLAWYDQNRPAVSDSLRTSLEKVRQAMASQKPFADAYHQAQQDLKQAGTQHGQQPQQQAYGPGSVDSWQGTAWPNQYSYTPFPSDFGDMYGYSGLGYGYEPFLGYGYGGYGYGYSPWAFCPGFAFGCGGWPWWAWNCGPFGFFGRNFNNFNNNFNVFAFNHHHHNNRIPVADLFNHGRFGNGFFNQGKFGFGNVQHIDRSPTVARAGGSGTGQVNRTAVNRNLQGRTAAAAAVAPMRTGTDRSMRIFGPGGQQARLTFSQPSGTAVRRTQIASGMRQVTPSGQQPMATLQQRQFAGSSGDGVIRGSGFGSSTGGPTVSGPGAQGIGRPEVSPRPSSLGGTQVTPGTRMGAGGSIGRVSPQMSVPWVYSNPAPSVSVPRSSFGGGMPAAGPSYNGSFGGGASAPRGGMAAPAPGGGVSRGGVSSGGFRGGGGGGGGFGGGGGHGGGGGGHR